VNNVADYGDLGKFSQIDYDHGVVLIDRESFVYLAFYFSTYNARNIVEACVPRETSLNTPLCRGAHVLVASHVCTMGGDRQGDKGKGSL